MVHFEIKVSEVDEPTCLSTIQHLGLAKIDEILVVGEDLDREGGTMKVVSPRFQGTDDGKEFLVVDVIVSFCGGERRKGMSKDANPHWNQFEGGWHRTHILKCRWQLQRGQRGWEGGGRAWKGRGVSKYQRQIGRRETNSKLSSSW